MKRIYLFDIDGTLLATAGAGLRSMNKAFESLLGVSNAQGNADYSGRVDHDIFYEVTSRTRGIPPTDDEMKLLKYIYMDCLEKELGLGQSMRVMPGVEDWLKDLAGDADAIVGLATGNLEKTAYLKLEFAGLRKYFHFGAFGDSDHDRTLIIRRAMDLGRARANDQRHAIFVIGDSKNDILCGKQAGAMTVAVATGKSDVKTLALYKPDFIFEDFSDYRAADQILKGSIHVDR